MRFYADLHIHSKYSRATSKNCDLEHLALWARRKGISVVATGDFTHPAWFDEIREKLVPAEPGLFRLRPDLESEIDRRLPGSCAGPTRFMLEVEISTIYKKGEKTRKVHHLIYAPDIDTASRFRDRLGQIGNIASDGRPILGLDSRHLLEITLESGPDAYLVPAHIWTPWFAVLGSKSGFDTVEDCYGDLAGHIFAVETGLSSDPPMNWRVSLLDRYSLVSSSDAHSPPMLGREACVFSTELDYFAMRQALENGEGYEGTVEFFPEEGKYHMDGHRACQVRLEPEETRRHDGRCPECGKPVTVGVMHRVESLADRTEPIRPEKAAPFRSLVPLPEIMSEICGVGPKSKTVGARVASLVARLGPELEILERLPLEDLGRHTDPVLTEAIDRLRRGHVVREGGYDGEYGTIRMFEPGELAARTAVPNLFGEMVPAPAPPAPEPSPPSPLPGGEGGSGGESDSLAGRESSATEVHPQLPFDPPVGEPASVLDRLDPDQRAAAEILDGPLLIIAGPGTGKTRTLTHRIAHLVGSGVAAPEQCLAITFTRRAAEELRERLEDLLGAVDGRVPVHTFHSLGLRILRAERAELGLHRGFRIAEESERLGLARELFGLTASRAARLLTSFSRARRDRASAVLDETVAAQLATYETALWARDLVDFDDLLVLPARLLSERADLRDTYREHYRWISIDEYQDVDALQYRLVRLLAPEDANLCAIGDPDQSIYRFRGAQVGFFLRFQGDYPSGRVVHLGRNYRSSRVIVGAATSAIAPASLVAERELRAVDDREAEPVVVLEAASERAEAGLVAHSIEQLLGGTSYYSVDSGRVAGGGSDLSFDDFAVLYRADVQSGAVMEALDHAGIPFQKRSHTRLVDRPEVRTLVDALRCREHTGAESSAVLDRLRAEAERIGAAESEVEPDDEEPELDRTASLRQAVELVAPLAKRHGDDLAGFLAEIALGAEVDTWDPRAERVSLLTLHAAKGLEFPVVFIVGCEDGLLPLRFAEADDDEIEEERRLFFVGITRARSRLFLSHARRRAWRGKVRDRHPSPFLRDIEKTLLEHRRATVRERPRDRGPKQLRLLP
ncbi:MAG: UvrD-helicase domain-containing protein [bacterium]|nr:UvrD-helicase domain-containing protein [bacterium]